MTTTPAYQELAGEPVEWLIMRFGDEFALGFRATDPSYIERAGNLFANLDWDPITRRQGGELNYLTPNLAFLHISLDRILHVLKVHFHTAVKRLELKPKGGWSGEGENETYAEPEWDEAEVERRADRYAKRFIENHVRTSSFLPSTATNSGDGYGVWTPGFEPSSRVEDLASQESA